MWVISKERKPWMTWILRFLSAGNRSRKSCDVRSSFWLTINVIFKFVKYLEKKEIKSSIPDVKTSFNASMLDEAALSCDLSRYRSECRVITSGLPLGDHCYYCCSLSLNYPSNLSLSAPISITKLDNLSILSCVSLSIWPFRGVLFSLSFILTSSILASFALTSLCKSWICLS